MVVSEGKRLQLASTVFSEKAEALSPARAVNPAKTAALVGQDIFKAQHAIAPAMSISDAKKGEMGGSFQPGSGLASGAAEAPYLATVALSDGKRLELSGHNSVFNPKGEDAKAAMQLSQAKRRELVGGSNEEFFTGGTEAVKAEASFKLSEGKQRELSAR